MLLVNDFLSNCVDRFPDKEALICPEGRFTYKELGEKVKSLSSLLFSLNVEKSDRVIIFLENSLESVVSIFGILDAGCIFVVINPQVRSKKLEFIINDCKASVLITDNNHLDQIRDILGNCFSLKSIILTDSNIDGRLTFTERTILLSPFYTPEILNESMDGVQCESDADLASIIYTSGSTGFPKGVMMSHKNMCSAADSIIKYLENTSDDIIFSVLPLSFDYGLYQVLMSFRFGGTVFLEKSFGFPHYILKKIKDEKVSGLPIVPTIANILLRMKDLKKYKLNSLRYITNTAQRLPKKTIFGLLEAFPDVSIYSMYGLTECKRVTYLPPGKLRLKPDSVGKAMPNTEAFIVDENGNKINRADVVGELVVKGPNVMVGYWNNQDETGKVIKPGEYPGDRWLFTGDLFKMDDDGDLYFVGRKDDIIKTAGEKVSPKEVENVLYELEDVMEAAVVGVPDDLLGEAIKAFVTLKNGSILKDKDIIKFCTLNLESFMVPKYVEIRKELPKTSTGKISKKNLVEKIDL